MKFEIGDKVIVANHGIGEITKVGHPNSKWKYYVKVNGTTLACKEEDLIGINTEFKVGKCYKLRDDYPELEHKSINFEGRRTFWNENMIEGFKNGAIRKCLMTDTNAITFEKVEGGEWYYDFKSFEEVEEESVYGNVKLYQEISGINTFYDEYMSGIRSMPRTIYNVDGTIYKDTESVFKNNEVDKMKIEDMKPENLEEAQKQCDKERTNAEIEAAKFIYKEAVDEVNKIDRQKKHLDDQKKELDKDRKIQTDIIKGFKRK